MCAWQFGDSFDPYAAPADAVAGYWDSGTQTGGVTLVAGRFAGSQAYTISSASGNQVYLAKSSGMNEAVHHVSVAFRQTGALSGTNIGASFQLLDNTTGQCCVCFRQDGTILFTSATPAGTVLATYAGAVTAQNTWFQFEFEVIISATVGRFRARKNGNTADDFDSGATLNTRPGANSYANKLQVTQGPAAVTTQQIDDLLWRSDASSVPWAGDIRCITRMPASDAAVQFARTGVGVLTQTVPPTENSSAPTSSTTARFTPFVAAYGGTITSTSAVIGPTASGNAKCAIYADDGTGLRPGVVLATAAAPVAVIVGSNVFTFSGLVIVKGTQYWIAVMLDNATGQWRVNNTTFTSLGVTATASYATFPQNNPVASTGQNPVQMSWTYTATPANWQAVAEPQQDGTTTYVYDATPGNADLYTIASIAPSTPASTIAVTTRAFMAKSDAGTRTAAVQLKSGGTTVAAPTLTLTTGFLWSWRTDTTNPATGSAWTAAQVAALQVGPRTVA